MSKSRKKQPEPVEWGKLKFIPGPNRGRMPYCHSLFWKGETRVIIDPASDEETLRRIADEGGVDVILLSHFHEDHFTFAHLFGEAERYIHKLDAPALADEETFIHYYGLESEEAISWLRELLRDFYKYTPRPPDMELEDGQVLDFGDLHVEVIHTPGHSAGHCCFYLKEPDVLFLADMDLTPFGPWYGDRYSELDAFIESVGKVRDHPARWKVTAHEEGVLEGDLRDRWDQYLDVINQRESKLLDFLAEPRTLEEIVDHRIVFLKPREPHQFYDFAEESTMLKHLEKLMEKGIVKKEGDRYVKVK